MKLYQDTSGIDKVVNTASKIVDTTEKVVNLVGNIGDVGGKVGKMKTSTKIGLLLGGALALSLFPLRLSYDSKTGEGEYKSLAVSVKRTQRLARTTDGRTHDLSWEAFPTVKVKPQDVKPCELPPAVDAWFRAHPLRTMTKVQQILYSPSGDVSPDIYNTQYYW